MNYGYRIRELRKSQKLSITELSKLSNVSVGYISKMERNLFNPTMSVLSKISKGLGLPFDLFLRKIGVKNKSNNTIKHSDDIISNYVKLPVVGSIACGDPKDAIKETSEYELAPASIATSPECFYLRADGDSMLPNIQNGALVIIDPTAVVDNENVAAVSINDGDATLKRVIKNGAKVVMLHPDNTKYNDIVPNDENKCRIIGKAIAVTNKL